MSVMVTLTPCRKGPGKVHCKVMDGDPEQLDPRDPLAGHILQTAGDLSQIKGGGCTICTVYQM